jgi:hypothetical protein
VCAIAIVAVLAPWHDVRDSGLGEAIGCAFRPDCHVTPTSHAARMAGPPKAIHSGLDHGGWIFLAGLALYAGMRVQAMRRPRRAWFGVLAFAGLLLAVLFGLEATLGVLAHLFDVTTERWGYYLVVGLGPAFLACAIVDTVIAIRWRR